MPRGISGPTLTNILSDFSKAVILGEFEFPSGDGGTYYVNNSGIDILYGGNTYIGLGEVVSIGAMTETSELGGVSLQVQISGIPQVNLQKALALNYQGNYAILSLATLDDNYQVETSSGPFPVFRGRMDTMQIEYGETATITININSRLADWETPHGGRYNHGYQKYHVDLTDQGFEYMAQLADIEIVWGIPGRGTILKAVKPKDF
jgi:hypothetical protein